MTADSSTGITAEPDSCIFLPDPLEESRDGTVFDHLGRTGNAYFLDQYMGSLKTTVHNSGRYISPEVAGDPTGLLAPDLFVAFDADPENFHRRNGYVISEQGKPPDFALEIASEYTCDLDVAVKRDAYEELGILEYWRFDPTGEYNEACLAADRLVDGRYQPMIVEQMEVDIWQGYSPILNVNIRWERGKLEFYNPGTNRHLSALVNELALSNARREARAETARADAAEARVRELEAELRRLRED